MGINRIKQMVSKNFYVDVNKYFGIFRIITYKDMGFKNR